MLRKLEQRFQPFPDAMCGELEKEGADRHLNRRSNRIFDYGGSITLNQSGTSLFFLAASSLS